MGFLIALAYISLFTYGFAFLYFFNYGVTLIDFSAIALYIVLFYGFFFKRRSFEICLNLPNILIFVFSLTILFSSFRPLVGGDSAQLVQFIKTTSHFYYILLIVFLFYYEKVQPKHFLVAIKAIIYAMLVINLFGIYQVFARAYNLPLAWLELTNKGIFSRSELIWGVQQISVQFGKFYRATSIFSEPSVLAFHNVYLFIFLVIPWIQYRYRILKNNKFYVFMVVLCIITLFMTYSMTGALGLIGVLIAIVFFEKKESYITFFKVSLVVLVIIFFANLIMQEVFHLSLLELFQYRFKSIFSGGEIGIGGESLPRRKDNLMQSLSIWSKYPLLGVGFGLLGYQKGFTYSFSDTTLTSILAECGIFNALIFVVFMLSLLYFARKIYIFVRERNDVTREEKILVGMSQYIMVFEIIRCFFTANILVYFVLWLNLGFVIYIVNRLCKYYGYKYLGLKL